jgi:hypothetical protein
MLIQYKTTAHFVVSYDSTFTGGPGQANGPALAQDVVDYCEYDLVRISKLFGNIMPPAASLPIHINLVPGTGGGNNNGSNLINLNCNVNTNPGLGLPGIMVAELVEIFMVFHNKGWVAFGSNGEALSRVLGGILYPTRAWLFQVGNDWLKGNSGSPHPARANFVDNYEATDTDFVSTGCGTLFLNYLASQLNFKWPDIIGAGAPNTHTLAETATNLGVSNAWVNFINLITMHLPPGSSLPAQPTAGIGQPPQPTDNPFPLGPLPAQLPALYIRHNLADNGTSHTGSLANSPDVILRNSPAANPQAAYSTAASINSDTESDTYVLVGQDNYVYTRVWNRGVSATNVFATVYWSPPATLIGPNMWNLIGSAYYPDVPGGSVVQVSNPGITWPADKIPGPGHYCFVAVVGNAIDPPPNPTNFAAFDDFVNYIYANNDITWRNFNVLPPTLGPIKFPFGEFIPLNFFITGAWDKAHEFTLETQAELPEGSRMMLLVPQWLGRGLKPAFRDLVEFDDPKADPENRHRVRLTLDPYRPQRLGAIDLHAHTKAVSELLVQVPAESHARPHKVIIRQLYKEREVGRVTWVIPPRR